MSKSIFAFIVAASLAGTSAQASVTFYSSSAAFNAAVTTVASENFDTRPTGPQGVSQNWGGIDIAATGSNDIYVAPANSGFYAPNDFNTRSLTADGNENFSFALHSGASFNALGMDVITNPYGPVIVSLYAPGGAFITSFNVPLAASTKGFFGFVSSDALGKVTTSDDRGYLIDVGFDNLQLGNAAAVPEPASWAMMIGGLAVAGAAMRRKARVAFAN